MDLLELALNPRKAAQRFSPFTNEMPEGMARKLEYYFGDNATADPGERVLYSRDAATPPATLALLMKRDAWSVVRPQIRGDLIELIKYANANGVPIVPRGAGTSGYGGGVPTEGGVVVDMRDFNKVHAVDAAKLTVRCDGNVTFADLEKALAPHGLALRQYPTSYLGATVAGWIAQGGGGVGSAKYGPFSRDVLEVTLVQPDGATSVVTGEDLDLVNAAFGTTGFIVEVVLKVRKANPIVPYVATFPDLPSLSRAVRRVGREVGAYSVHVHTPDYANAVNEAAKAKVLPQNKWSVLVAVEDVGNAQQIEILKGIVKTGGGEFAKDADAKRIWDARFNHLNVKRLGPSVVVSEVIHSMDSFEEAYAAARDAAKMERGMFWAVAVSPKELDLIYYGLEDERRATYPAALGNALAVIDAVRAKVGGRPYATGVLQVNEAVRTAQGGSRLPTPGQLLAGLVGGIVGAGAGAALLLLAHLLGFGTATAVLTGLSLGVGAPLLGAVVFGAIFTGVAAAGGPALRPGDRVFSFLIAQAWTLVVYVVVWLVVSLWLVPPMFGVPSPGLSIESVLLGLVVVAPFALAFGVAGAILAYPMPGAVGKIRKFRDETDPKDVFNPGPVVGGRSRVMPLPVRDLALQLTLAGPLLKMQRGMFEYKGGDKADPSTLALSTAVGRANAGDLAEVAYDVTTCIHCAFCNAVAPERAAARLESATPRGRVQLASALLAGKFEPTREVHRRVAMAPLHHNPDAICPTMIPITRTTDLLLGACVDALGPLPEHAPLAANAEKEWNVLGKPKDARSKWATVAWTNESRVAYLPDDVAAYEAPEIAAGAAAAITGAGTPLAHLGKADRTTGSILVETGQREAARVHAVTLLEELTKRNVHTVVTPDAGAVRVIRHDWPLLAKGEDDLVVPEVVHAASWLARELKAKRLEFGEPWSEKVVLHAPEGLTPEERQACLDVLKATGATVVDAPHLECGHGRALDKTYPVLAASIGEACLKAAAATGAKFVVTASPGCHVQLKAIAKKAKAGVEVLDLHAVVAQRMVSRAGGAAPAPAATVTVEEKPAEPVIGEGQFRVEFVKEGVVLAVGKNQTILEAGEEAGITLPSSCKAGSCDTCSARWEGSPADQSAGAALSADQQKTFVLTCIAKPRGPIKIWSDERPK